MSRTLPNHPASKCHPPVPSPASGSPGTEPVGVGVGDEPGFVGVVDGELVVAGAEGDVLVGGDECGGVEDFRALVVGRAERVALGVSDAVPRLVPVEKPAAGLAGREAVVGDPVSLADWRGDWLCPTFPVVVDAGVVLLVSRRTMIAMIPQAARPAPANTRARRRGRGPVDHTGSSL